MERAWEGEGASVMAWVESKREENTMVRRRFLLKPIVSERLSWIIMAVMKSETMGHPGFK